MKNQNLPHSDHILRLVPYGRTMRDEQTDALLGLLGAAFRRKGADGIHEEEEFLSVTWIEHYAGCYWEQLILSFKAICRVQKPGAKAAIAWAEVGKVHAICRSQNANVRIVHEDDSTDNPGHSGIRRLPRDNETLLEMLATEAFVNFCQTATVP